MQEEVNYKVSIRTQDSTDNYIIITVSGANQSYEDEYGLHSCQIIFLFFHVKKQMIVTKHLDGTVIFTKLTIKTSPLKVQLSKFYKKKIDSDYCLYLFKFCPDSFVAFKFFLITKMGKCSERYDFKIFQIIGTEVLEQEFQAEFDLFGDRPDNFKKGITRRMYTLQNGIELRLRNVQWRVNNFICSFKVDWD